jgi:hypothetical protein
MMRNCLPSTDQIRNIVLKTFINCINSDLFHNICFTLNCIKLTTSKSCIECLQQPKYVVSWRRRRGEEEGKSFSISIWRFSKAALYLSGRVTEFSVSPMTHV